MNHKFGGAALLVLFTILGLAACAPLQSKPDALPAAVPGFRYAAIATIQGQAKTGPSPAVGGGFELRDYTFAITGWPTGAVESHVTLEGSSGNITVTEDAKAAKDSGEYTITAENGKTYTAKVEVVVNEIAIWYATDGSQFDHGQLRRDAVLGPAGLLPTLVAGSEDLPRTTISNYRWTIAGTTGTRTETGVVTTPGIAQPGKLDINANTGAITGDNSTLFTPGTYTIRAAAGGNAPLEYTFTVSKSDLSTLTNEIFYTDIDATQGMKQTGMATFAQGFSLPGNFRYKFNSGTVGITIAENTGTITVAATAAAQAQTTYMVTITAARDNPLWKGKKTVMVKITVR